MKHLTNFEEFGYHSDTEEKQEHAKYNENFDDDEFAHDEFQRSKERGDESELDKERCYKCRKPGKPDYVPTLGAIPRLMN